MGLSRLRGRIRSHAHARVAAGWRTLAVLSGAALVLLVPADGAHADSFRSLNDPVTEARAFDVGAIAIAGQSALAPFTTNHKFANSFVVGGRNKTRALNLVPTPAFPGYEDMLDKPRTKRTGLYLYGRDRPGTHSKLALKSVGTVSSGSVSFPARKDPRVGKVDAQATATRVDGRGRVDFVIQPGGHVNVQGAHLDLPIDVDIEAPEAGRIFVGARGVEAKRPQFTVSSRDRHGLAVGDFDQDGRQDLFVAVGGLQGAGKSPEFVNSVTNEVQLRARSGKYRRESDDQLKALGCRGREAAAPDVDGDGSPEVFEGCEGDRPRLYDRSENGGWESHKLPLQGEDYRWANVDRDPEVELLALRGHRLETWNVGRRGARLGSHVSIDGKPTGLIALGALNGDRWVDAIVPSLKGTTILLGGRTRFHDTKAGRLHLPNRSAAAAIVDFDNDGDSDLDLAPQGLFERRGDRFHKLGKLETKGRYAMLSWPDFDNDGRRDFMATTGIGPFQPHLDVSQKLNRMNGGRWLQLDLPDALGARVTVHAGKHSYTGWSGAAEGSRWSDAHRRVYFGLGRARRAKVKVHWPEGGSKRLSTRTNRLIEIRHR